MANFCYFDVRVIGSKKEGLMVFGAMPCLDDKELGTVEKKGGKYCTSFSGNCKWSVNYGVTDDLEPVDVDSMSESEIDDVSEEYWDYSLRAKSEAFGCEILAHYWSEESGFDQFDHYKNGKEIKKRKIAYNEKNKFDWDKTEFIGHEGEYDESIDGEAQDTNFMSMLSSLTNLTQNVNEGSDFSIGDSGFSMINWSFTEGKTVRGNGWSIAIPDGFVKTKSNDTILGGEHRLFQLVPITSKDEKIESEVPVIILPGAETPGNSFPNGWMVHPKANAGFAGLFTSLQAKTFPSFLGSLHLFSVGWNDLAAGVMIQNTGFGTYSYQCTVFSGEKMQQLRIQTHEMSDEQRDLLDKSVISWLKTMKYDAPNKSYTEKTKFESQGCYNDHLRGKTEKFVEAVNQAETEYATAINGKLKMLEYMGENGLLDDHTSSVIKEILSDGMEVKSFFLEKADQLIEKLRKQATDPSLIKTALSLLSPLDEDVVETDFNEEKIKITVPQKVTEIRDKWKKLAPDVYSSEAKQQLARQKDIEKRKKEIEERKKAKKEREKADYKAEDLCSDIRRKKRSIESTYERNVNQHKREMQSQSYDGLWDPRIYEQLPFFENDVQNLGSEIEILLKSAIEQYYELNNLASPKVMIEIIDEMLDAIEYVENGGVDINTIGVSYSYNWSADISEVQSELKSARTEYTNYQKQIEKEEKKQDEEDERFEYALLFDIDEKDVEKHKEYLSAKNLMKKAKKSKDYEAASKQFGSIKGYLDSKDLKTECDEKSRQLKKTEDVQKAVDKATKDLKKTENELKNCETVLKESAEIRDKVVGMFDKMSASYLSDKEAIEEAQGKVISGIKAKLSVTGEKIASLKKELDEKNIALEKTFALAFGKKKSLRNEIDLLVVAIATEEIKLNEYKDKLKEAEREKAEKLKKLDDDLRALENDAELKKENFTAAEKDMAAVKVNYEKAKAALDAALKSKLALDRKSKAQNET